MKRKSMAVIGMVIGCLMMVAGGAWAGGKDDGTVEVDGKVMLKDAGFIGSMTWDQANTHVKSIQSGNSGLTDGSKAGDWRLPNAREMSYACDKLHNVKTDKFYWINESIDSTKAWATYMAKGCGKNSGTKKNENHYVVPIRNKGI